VKILDVMLRTRLVVAIGPRNMRGYICILCSKYLRNEEEVIKHFYDNHPHELKSVLQVFAERKKKKRVLRSTR